MEGIIFRYRAGIAWRDLPREQFGLWQTVWKRHRGYATDGTWDKSLTFLLTQVDAAGKIDWNVSVDASITRAHQHATNTTRLEQDTGGGGESQESTAVVDGHGRPLALVVTGGQRHDGVMWETILGEIHVPRPGRGRARSCPDAVLADRGYASGVTRRQLRRRGIKTVIPEKRDSITARKRRGSTGGRPPAFDAVAYRGRNVVERRFCDVKQWRGLATRYDVDTGRVGGPGVAHATTDPLFSGGVLCLICPPGCPSPSKENQPVGT